MKRAIDKSGGKSIVYEPNRDMLIQIKLANKGSNYYIPFRPIVFGGDDVTFVCDCRLGLSLATAYFREFWKQSVDLGQVRQRAPAMRRVSLVQDPGPSRPLY